MSRNTLNDVQSGIQGWDATINDNISVLQDTPLPIVEYTTIGSIPAANIHDRSLAMGNHAERGWCPFFSDGTNWIAARPYGIIAPLTISNVGSITTDNFQYDVHDTVNANEIPMLASGRIVSFSISTRHLNGSLPADWTLTITNVTTATSVTASVGWNAANNTYEATVGTFSAELAVSAGDAVSASMAGAAVNIVIATLLLQVDYDFKTTSESV